MAEQGVDGNKTTHLLKLLSSKQLLCVAFELLRIWCGGGAVRLRDSKRKRARYQYLQRGFEKNARKRDTYSVNASTLAY